MSEAGPVLALAKHNSKYLQFKASVNFSQLFSLHLCVCVLIWIISTFSFFTNFYGKYVLLGFSLSVLVCVGGVKRLCVYRNDKKRTSLEHPHNLAAKG